MSDFPTPVWWVDADRCAAAVIQRGAVAGEGEVTDDIALVLSGDSSFAIEGTREQVIDLLERAAAAVRS